MKRRSHDSDLAWVKAHAPDLLEPITLTDGTECPDGVMPFAIGALWALRLHHGKNPSPDELRRRVYERLSLQPATVPTELSESEGGITT